MQFTPPTGNICFKWRGGDAMILCANGTIWFCPEIDQAKAGRELVESMRRHWSAMDREKAKRIADLEGMVRDKDDMLQDIASAAGIEIGQQFSAAEVIRRLRSSPVPS